MKKEKLNEDFDLVQPETDEEIDFLAKTATLFITRDPEGNLYCCDYSTNRVVKYNTEKKKWERYDEYFNGELSIFDFESLTNEEAEEIYKNNPPFEALEAAQKEDEAKANAYWDKMRKETKHRVVGWVAYADDLYDYANDKDGSYSAAVINDIVEHDCLFAGEVIDLVPVFEDHTFTNFSSRGWGHIMAISKGETEEMDYVSYTFAPYLDEHSRMPEEGFYEGEKIKIKVDINTYKDIVDKIVNFEDNAALKEYNRCFYILDRYHLNKKFDQEKFYEFYLENDENKEKVYLPKVRVITFSDIESYHLYVDGYSEEERWKNMVIADHMRIEEDLEKGPVTLLVVISV